MIYLVFWFLYSVLVNYNEKTTFSRVVSSNWYNVCVRVDFQCRVILVCKWYRGNVWKVVRERKKLNSLNFYVYAQTFIHSLYFIYECKINARTHVKIRWRFVTYGALFDLWFEKILSPKSRTFSPNDIYPYLSCGEWRSKGTGKSVYVSNFFLHQNRLLTSQGFSLWRKMQISSSSGLFVLFIRLYKVNFLSVSHVD